MRRIRGLAPGAILMARRCDFGSLQAAYEDCRSQIIEFDVTTDDLSEMEACRELGVHSMIYSQTDQITDLEALAAMSPDYGGSWPRIRSWPVRG